MDSWPERVEDADISLAIVEALAAVVEISDVVQPAEFSGVEVDNELGDSVEGLSLVSELCLIEATECHGGAAALAHIDADSS